ncbi:Phosphatidylinositol 4-kinase LSB6 [Candida viswanathii]|uniref:Phosphatidylinositol 4-kinase n=1 Tax=Candida viswanathii TaxID=5486 RepID=A0A367XS83_9ASCO|nr:Phosphatidylinositol 4-kinase LSB6 [Candida viswanathii]
MPENTLDIPTDRDESVSPTGFSTTPENSTDTTMSHCKHDNPKELPHIDEVDEDDEYLDENENENGDTNGSSSKNDQALVSPVTPKRDTPHKNLLSHSWHYASYNVPHTPTKNDTGSSPSTPLLQSRSQPVSRRASVDDMRLPSHQEKPNFNFRKSFLIPAAKWAYLPISKIRRATQTIVPDPDEQYVIEYSVFRPVKGLKELRSHKDILIHFRDYVELETHKPFAYPENFVNEGDFNELITRVTRIIEEDKIYPERIATGSSGSYFIFDIDVSLHKAAIFKPKDEEPYGPLLPKWTKWAHRTFFPCCFGRSCLIPNLGYISEVAACVLDRQLQTYIVPHTEIVELRSPTFFYNYWDKNSDVSKLHKKKGSFQLFLKGYINADIWLKIYPIPAGDTSTLKKSSSLEVPIDSDKYTFTWSQESMFQFQEELEKLVILDYLMRNTDRGLDNWMIRVDWRLILKNAKTKIMKPTIKIGAIDSGLAFPWKHPDEWRSFPFGWLFLPLTIIGQPFSRKTRNHFLPLLTSKSWWEETVPKLKKVFMQDNDFRERMWLKQLAVLKGQAFNIVEILKLTYAGPLELTRRENLLVIDDIMYMPNGKGDYDFMKSSMYEGDIFKRYNVKGGQDDEEEQVGLITDNTPLLQNSHGSYLEVSLTLGDTTPAVKQKARVPKPEVLTRVSA